MSDSEKQVREFVSMLETVTLGKWMVNMQNFASRLPEKSSGFLLLCVSCAADELLKRYRKEKELHDPVCAG